MKINVAELPTFSQPVVGNVYACNGGYGRKAGHAMVLLAITPNLGVTRGQSALLMVINKDGEPIGVTAYGVHAIEERAPIAFVEGLADLTFDMVPLK